MTKSLDELLEDYGDACYRNSDDAIDLKRKILSMFDRKPLSSEELMVMAQQANRATNPYYEFARAIEAAHGIGVNHE